MGELNNTEKYMLCLLGKGLNVKKIKQDRIFTCLVLSEIMELSEKNIIQLDEKRKIVSINQFVLDKSYIEIVYNDLKDGRYKKIKSYIEKFIYSLSSKDAVNLIQSVIDYLIQHSLVTETSKKGLLGEKVEYQVSKDVTDKIIEEIISEYNKDKIENKNTIYLSALLLVSGVLIKYVSKDEIKKINKRIKVLRKEDPNLFVKEIWDGVFTSEILAFAVSSL